MWPIIVGVGGSLVGGYLFLTRGKANIGDTVEFTYKFGGAYGEQGLVLQGRVIEKTNPIVGPYYKVQLFQAPKAIPEIEMLKANIPSTVGGLTDKDILRNLGKK